MGVSIANKNLFYNYPNLNYIDLPNCTTINEQTFADCAALSFVSLPKVSIIYQNAFQNCLSLEKLILPNCSYIVANAFNNCPNLKTLTLLSDKLVEIQANTFMSCDAINKIYVPENLYESYKSHYIWKNYETQLEKLGSYCANKFEIND